MKCHTLYTMESCYQLDSQLIYMTTEQSRREGMGGMGGQNALPNGDVNIFTWFSITLSASSVYKRAKSSIFTGKQFSLNMSNMYQNVQDFNEAEEEKLHLECRYEQPSTNIDIPSSNNSSSRDLFYKQMSPQYQEFYSDILSFTSGNAGMYLEMAWHSLTLSLNICRKQPTGCLPNGTCLNSQ